MMVVSGPTSVSRRYHGHAAGKVILLGEHAVVYGSPALVIGLDRGASAEVQLSEVTELVLGDSRHLLEPEPSAEEALPARAFRALLQLFSAPKLTARATLALPAGAGLGASAAIGVALARAITELSTARGLAVPSVASAALTWENVFHGNASGVDTAAAEQGGCLWFRRGQAPERLAPGRPLTLLIAQVEQGASTRRMVEGVATQRAAQPARVDGLLADIAALVERARVCLLAGEHGELGQLMSRNHHLLAELGVSTPALDRAVSVAEQAGALGAKLTGAGGGGCVVALVDGARRETVREAWRSISLSCWPAPD